MFSFMNKLLFSIKASLWLILISFLYGNSSEQQKNISSVSEYENQLYLTPGGKYTTEDIHANGKMTRSQKFKDYISSHNLHVQTGDFICPITLVKANPACTWIIGGRSYQFCCPSCIDEFLALAKKSPQEIHDPEHYVK
jgi:hypothetical protein